MANAPMGPRPRRPEWTTRIRPKQHHVRHAGVVGLLPICSPGRSCSRDLGHSSVARRSASRRPSDVDTLLTALASGTPLDEPALALLNGLAGGCASWLGWADLVPPRLASDLGYAAVERLSVELRRHVRLWLCMLVTKALEGE